MHCNTSRSRPHPSTDAESDIPGCSSVKGAGVPAEEGTEHYFLWWWIRNKFIITNVDTLSQDDSSSHLHSFSSDDHEFGGMASSPLPLDPPMPERNSDLEEAVRIQ